MTHEVTESNTLPPQRRGRARCDGEASNQPPGMATLPFGVERVFQPGDADYPTSKAVQLLLAKRGALNLPGGQVQASRGGPGRNQKLVSVASFARDLGAPERWIVSRLKDGTVPFDPQAYDCGEPCLPEAGLKLLRAYWDDQQKMALIKKSELLGLVEASSLAGVAHTTLIRWAKSGEVRRFLTPYGWRYLKSAVIARARYHWVQTNDVSKRPDWVSGILLGAS